MLDPEARRDLRSLTKETADQVARHLVVAGQLLDEDPETAYQHAAAARAMAGRVGIVREAMGIAAYTTGRYAEALAELRTARRISGSPEHLPVMADCERALGRPERALEVGRDPGVGDLDRAARIELKIVLAGARRDLREYDAAVLALQGPELAADVADEPAMRLWYAYADALLAAGRTADARQWFLAVASVDDDGSTDAIERLGAFAAGPEDPGAGGPEPS
jgi:tetratricopeptide (TPR) repeat protein